MRKEFNVSIGALGINGWMLPLRTEHVDSAVKRAKALCFNETEKLEFTQRLAKMQDTLLGPLVS